MEWLKKKGMAKADKKAGNVAVEGCVSSYVHFNNKIAVLVEVGCCSKLRIVDKAPLLRGTDPGF